MGFHRTRSILMGLLCLATALLGSARGRAQLPPPPSPVVAVRVEGVPATETVLDEIDVPLGTTLDRAQARALVQRLLAGGRWSDVQLYVEPAEGGERLVVVLRPRLLLERIDVVGNDALSDAAVQRALGLAPGTDVERDRLPQIEATVRESYAAIGYDGVRVGATLRETIDPSRMVLVVDVDEGSPTRIVRIVFDGEEPPRDLPLGRFFRRGEGRVLALREVEDAVTSAAERLRGAGYLEVALGRPGIERSGSSAVVRIPSHIGPRYFVAIVGQEPLPRSDVLAALELSSTPVDAPGLAMMERRVVDLYRRNGFLDVEVHARRTRSRVPGRAKLVVRVERGPPVAVTSVTFPGNEHFETSLLEQQIDSYLDELVRRGRFLAPVDSEVVDRLLVDPEPRPRRSPSPEYVPPERVYYEPAYAEAAEHVRALYEAEGFLEAQVGPVEVRRTRTDRLAVVIPVVEGPQTLVYDLEIAGNQTLSSRDISEATELLRDAPYSRRMVEEARARVLALYRDRGFLYADVRDTTRFSEDRSRAAIRLEIEERFEVHIGEVRVEGAVSTRESLIRSLLAFRSGDVLTATAARTTQNRLMEIGVFTSVAVVPDAADVAEPVKTVIVRVTERQNQFLDFRAGLSTAEGIRGAFEYGYRNLFGYGVQLNLRIQLSGKFYFLDPVLEERFTALTLAERLEHRVSATMLLPMLPRAPKLRTALNVLTMRDNERNFGINKNSIDLTFTHRPMRRLISTYSSALENNDVQIFSDQSYQELIESTADLRLKQLLRVPEGRSTLIALGSSIAWDRRDRPFNPRSGFYTSLVAEWAYTLSTETVDVAGMPTKFFSNHIRTMFTMSGYVPLARRTALALQAKIGRVFQISQRSETYPNRQFFVGGMDTVRAYLQDAMVPQDIIDQLSPSDMVDPAALVQGGNTFLVLRSELRFPIAGDLFAGVFAEFGNLWVEPNALDPLKLRPTGGFGLRFATPVGPVAIDYGFNFLHNRPSRQLVNERFGALNFSIGLF